MVAALPVDAGQGAPMGSVGLWTHRFSPNQILLMLFRRIEHNVAAGDLSSRLFILPKPCSTDGSGPFSLILITNRCYQTCGRRRYRLSWQYSRYPGRSRKSSLSSAIILQQMKGTLRAKMGRAHQEPKAIGVARYMASTPRYMGWRIMA